MTTIPVLDEHVQKLREVGYECSVDAASDGFFHLLIGKVIVPPAFSRTTVRVLVKIPRSYPNGKPDMFWVDEPFLLANGSVPEKGDVVETISGQLWRRFSWHPTTWNPAVDNLITYVQFVRGRLSLCK